MTATTTTPETAKIQEFVLFPSQTKRLGYEGEEADFHLFELFTACERGWLSEDGQEFTEDEDGEVYRMTWWDGNNTQEMWAHESDLEFVTFEELFSTSSEPRGTYQEYATYYKDVDSGELYVTESDNCQRNMSPEVRITEDIIERSADYINGDSGVFTKQQWLEMCEDANHENWPVAIVDDFYTQDEYDRYLAAGQA